MCSQTPKIVDIEVEIEVEANLGNNIKSAHFVWFGEWKKIFIWLNVTFAIIVISEGHARFKMCLNRSACIYIEDKTGVYLFSKARVGWSYSFQMQWLQHLVRGCNRTVSNLLSVLKKEALERDALNNHKIFHQISSYLSLKKTKFWTLI